MVVSEATIGNSSSYRALEDGLEGGGGGGSRSGGVVGLPFVGYWVQTFEAFAQV